MITRKADLTGGSPVREVFDAAVRTLQHCQNMTLRAMQAVERVRGLKVAFGDDSRTDLEVLPGLLPNEEDVLPFERVAVPNPPQNQQDLLRDTQLLLLRVEAKLDRRGLTPLEVEQAVARLEVRQQVAAGVEALSSPEVRVAVERLADAVVETQATGNQAVPVTRVTPEKPACITDAARALELLSPVGCIPLTHLGLRKLPNVALFTADEASAMTGIPAKKFHNAYQANKLAGVRLGRHCVRFMASHVRMFYSQTLGLNPNYWDSVELPAFATDMLWSVPQLAMRLRIDTSKVLRMIKRGDLCGAMVNRRWWVCEQNVRKVLVSRYWREYALVKKESAK